MREFGCDRVVRTPEECVTIEPAMAQCRDKLAGGIYTATDESGDAHVFTVELAKLAAARGVALRWRTSVEALEAEGDRISGVRVVDADGRRETLTADAIVVALGSFSSVHAVADRRALPRLPGEGLFDDRGRRRAHRRADGLADRPRVEDRA